MTQAFDIRIPLPWKRPAFLKSQRGDKERCYYQLATIWHVDPERDGTDDSCGWFIRTRHCNKDTLARIVKRFSEDWDRVYAPKEEDHDPDDGPFQWRVYHCGLFKPNGLPNLSVSAIVLNLFYLAVIEHLKCNGLTNWKQARRWMQANLFEVMSFAENPSDSLFDEITRKFYDPAKEPQTERTRDERMRNLAGVIYAFILRKDQRWWKHPRWHIHHWKIQVHPTERLIRWIFQRCARCGGRFGYNESRMGNWSGNQVWHEQCQRSELCK